MDIFNCQKDYSDNTISISYEGQYDERKMLSHVEQCYGKDFYVIVDHYKPNVFKGSTNPGIVTVIQVNQ